MSVHDVFQSGDAVAASDNRPLVDGFIRMGLLKAFPLPQEADPAEAKFRELLEALALRCREVEAGYQGLDGA